MGFIDSIKKVFGLNGGSAPAITKGKMVGEISHFNYRKGYGFIEVPKMENRIFLHVSELSGKARKGKKVEFKVEQTDKGVKAKEAVILN